MNEKHNNATRNRPEGERVIDAPVVTIDIPAFIRQITHEDAWNKNDRNSITVFKTNDMRIVLGGLRYEAELSPHKSDGVMCMQVLSGSLEVNTDDLTSNVNKGEMIVIHKGCNYRIVAKEETIYLLTITGID